MKAWLITVGEPLPTDEGENRLLRTGLLTRVLAERDHEVTWWTSTFDHWRKIHRYDRDTVLDAGSATRIVLLRGVGYRKNISLRRQVDHALVAWRFSKLSKTQPRPDVIVCSLPTIELCAAATRYGKRTGVPVILDVRDLWPDIFLELAPPALRGMARIGLAPMFRLAADACRRAAAIIGNSPGFVEWGLRQAGRRQGPWDRDFPFGYSEHRPDAASIARATDFWRGLGLAERRPGAFLACFFGTISHQFDLETVIAAARKLRAAGRDFTFILCGTGGALDDYRKQARDCPNVIFPGWVELPHIWTLMRLADAGLAPYQDTGAHRDNLPNKPIEYMSAGLPIISSLSGYVRELLTAEDCGVSYRHGDAESLAQILVELHEDRARLKTMSGNAAALYKRKFVAETIYGQMSEYLEQVAEDRGGA